MWLIRTREFDVNSVYLITHECVCVCDSPLGLVASPWPVYWSAVIDSLVKFKSRRLENLSLKEIGSNQSRKGGGRIETRLKYIEICLATHRTGSCLMNNRPEIVNAPQGLSPYIAFHASGFSITQLSISKKRCARQHIAIVSLSRTVSAYNEVSYGRENFQSATASCIRDYIVSYKFSRPS